MNRAVLLKTLRDSCVLIVLAVGAIVLFISLFSLAIDYSLHDMEQYFRKLPPFVLQFLTLLAGADISRYMTPAGFMCVGFSHPVVHLVCWAFVTAFCTRVLAGEIDRGTADLLLTLPIGRARLYVTLTAAWSFVGVLLCVAPWVGAWIGQALLDKGPFDLPRLAIVCVNLFALYLAVGASAFAISAAATRRGPAIGLISGALLVSFALNFLAVFWSPARRVAFLGVLDYYKPLPIVATGQWPWHDLAVLTATAVAAWTAGLVIFIRRDIPAA
ncbi:MAG: hypothetical protein L6Q92_06220 [Phycisphaerae bacterium]|nr:hypothetical protein [Phycisphaerae bacterium]